MYKKFIYSTVLILAFGLSSTNLANAADPSLVGWWKLDETSGLIAADSSDTGNNGTLMNMSGDEWTDGILKGALELDGTDDYVDLGNSPSLQITGDLTIALWIKMAEENAGVYMGIAGKMNDATDNGYALVRHSSNVFRLWTAENGTFIEVDSNITYTDTQWHHLAGVRRNGTSYLYVDGVEQISRRAAGLGESENFAFIGRQYHDYDDRFFNGTVDDVRIYNRALSEAEVQQAMSGESGLSSAPDPENEAVDVPRDVILSWTPGEYADKHNLYLGTMFDDVNNAGTGSPLLIGPALETNSFQPSRLEFDQTYFWRVDEVNAPPDSTVFKGEVWSFTVESFAYPIPGSNITATASSQSDNQGPEKTIDGSGLDENDLHSTEPSTMWLSTGEEPGSAWIQYQFDKAYKLHQMLVWNYNGDAILALYGLDDVKIEYSTNAENWTQLTNVTELTKAPGEKDYAHNTTVAFDGAAAKFVKITANINWGGGEGFFNKYGLSEVRFTYIPVHAKYPNPEDGATNVAVDSSLSWRAGREAVEHKVSISTDLQALIDGTVPAVNVNQTSYSPSLDLGSTYYWCVEEVNNAETPAAWPGNIWGFSTQDYIVVDDFETYNDIPSGEDGSNLVYETWIDGYTSPSTNGSTIGYVTGVSMETDIIHGGNQSVALLFDNTTAGSSEVRVNTADLAIGRDWSVGSPQTLVLWIHGDLGNSAAEKLYVKVGSSKVMYDSDISIPLWKQWNIELASLDISLNNVASLSIGVGGNTTGMLFLDDIALYRQAPPVVEPVDPGTDSLVAQYAMENNVQDGSGNNRHGTAYGDPAYVQGRAGYGMAVSLDGEDDYVDLPIGSAVGTMTDCTIATWANWSGQGGAWQRAFDIGTGTTANMFLTPSTGAAMRFAITTSGSGAESQANASVALPTGWHHVAVVIDSTSMSMKLYLDGEVVASGPTQTVPADLGATTQNWLGRSQYSGDPYFNGSLDDFRIYNAALSDGEVRYIAGDR